MKIRLKKDKTINGKQAKAGWVFGVDEPTGNAWIAAGDAEHVVEEARALKYAPTAPVLVECVATDFEEITEEEAPAPKFLNQKK